MNFSFQPLAGFKGPSYLTPAVPLRSLCTLYLLLRQIRLTEGESCLSCYAVCQAILICFVCWLIPPDWHQNWAERLTLAWHEVNTSQLAPSEWCVYKGSLCHQSDTSRWWEVAHTILYTFVTCSKFTPLPWNFMTLSVKEYRTCSSKFCLLINKKVNKQQNCTIPGRTSWVRGHPYFRERTLPAVRRWCEHTQSSEMKPYLL